jgi:hypothetical protein
MSKRIDMSEMVADPLSGRFHSEFSNAEIFAIPEHGGPITHHEAHWLEDYASAPSVLDTTG